MKRKKRTTMVVVGIISVAIIAVFIYSRGFTSKNIQGADNTETEQLQKRDIVNSLGITGTFKSEKESSVYSELVNQKVNSVKVSEGDSVKKGAVLCTLDSSGIIDNLRNTKKDLSYAKEKNTLSEKSLRRKLSDAKETRNSQKKELDKKVDKAKKQWEKAKANSSPETTALKASYDSAVKERKSTNTANDNTIKELEESLASTKVTSKSSLSTYQNKIDEYEKQLKYAVVKAPISGVITQLNVAAGQMYSGMAVAVIENPTNFVISTEVDEYEISNIKKGMKVYVKTEATGEESLEAKVIYVAAFAAQTQSADMSSSNLTGTTSSPKYQIKVKLNEENKRIRLGMTAKMSIVLSEKRDVFAVPSDSIFVNKAGKKVLRVVDSSGQKEEEKEESTREIVVQTGTENNYFVEVISDELEEGLLIQVATELKEQSMESMMSDMRNNEQRSR